MISKTILKSKAKVSILLFRGHNQLNVKDNLENVEKGVDMGEAEVRRLNVQPIY